MADFEVTSMSSKGQVVIPQDIREQMGLKEGEKFTVIGETDTIILQRIKKPSFENFQEMLRKSHDFARRNNIKKKDVLEAIKRVRNENSNRH